MKIFVGLLAVIVLAAIIVGSVFWSRVPDIVSNNLSKKMQVAVSIDSFGLGWKKLDIHNIQIGNPPKSILSKAFTCREIDVIAPLTRYLNHHIVIDEIDVKDVYLGLEFDSPSGATGNWTTILGNLKRSMDAEIPAEKKNKKQNTQKAINSSDRSILIHKLVLTNIDTDVVYRTKGKVKRLPRIPRIELTEISSEGGLPTDQILNSVLGEMLKQVFVKENLKNMMQDFMNAPSPFKKYLEPFKGLFNTAPPLFHQLSASDKERVES